MSEEKYTKNLSINIDLVDYTDKFGNKYTVTNEEIENILSLIQHKVDLVIQKNKDEYLSQNKIFDFESFKVDSDILKNYTEDDEDKYKHFVWEFYTKYFINFKKDSEEHLELIENLKKFPEYYKDVDKAKKKLKKLNQKFKKNSLEKHEFDKERHEILRYIHHPITIKNYILNFLGVSNIIESNPYHSKKHLLMVNKENFKNFVDFTIGSGMLSLDEMVYKDMLYENSISIDNFTVGSALINLCIHLDYQEGFEYLINMNISDKCIDVSEEHHSWIYMFIRDLERQRQTYHEEYDYILENNLTQEVKSVYGENSDRIDIIELNKLIRKFKWINIITTKFPNLKLGYINQNGSVIEENGRRYWSSASVKYEYFIIQPDYLNIKFHDKNFTNLIYNHFSKEFIKNNTLPFTKEVQLIKEVFDYFENINDDKKVCKLFQINHNNIDCEIVKIRNGGYIENNKCVKEYNKKLEVKEVYFTRDKTNNTFSVYFFNNINPGYTGSDYKLENKFDISEFIEDKDALIFAIKEWLSGFSLKQVKAETFINSDNKKILKEIELKQKELEELQKKIRK